jgi:hypothetical protein
LVALVCGVGPFVAACRGYGGYLRASWLFMMWIAPMVGMAVLACLDLVRRLNLLAHGRPPGPATLGWRSQAGITALLVSWLAFFAGWGGGVLCRDVHCQQVYARCEPILEALEKHKSEHGAYPDSLDALANIDDLRVGAEIDIREGRFLEHGIDVGITDEADAVVYVGPGGYTCVVPIERRLPFSISRFYVYMRNSGESSWQHDYLVWMLSAVKE